MKQKKKENKLDKYGEHARGKQPKKEEKKELERKRE